MFVKAFTSLSILSAVAVPILADSNFQKESRTDLPKYIEPDVRRYTNVIPPEVCRKIIELGEAVGFPLEHDSIDSQSLSSYQNNRSQAIDVMDENGDINQPAIFDELRPYIPKMAELIREQRSDVLNRVLFPDEPDDRLPRLGWIFYRKYSPDSPRNALIPHFDLNVFTVNVALNDDFTGGGLFYVKPTYALNPDWDPDQEKNLFFGPDGDGIPILEEHQLEYEWVNSLTHSNTSDVVFPELATGDALIHNYTVWHAVAPLEKGTRYSMVLFFDMHNPMMKGNVNDEEYDEESEEFMADVYDEGYEDGYEDGYEHGLEDSLYEKMANFDGEDDNEDEVSIEIQVRHSIRECDLKTGEVSYIQDNIDVIWVNPEPDSEDDEFDMIVANLKPGQLDDPMETYSGHEFRAVRSPKPGEEPLPLGSRDVLATIIVENNKKVYEFISNDQKIDDCAQLSAEMTIEKIHRQMGEL